MAYFQGNPISGDVFEVGDIVVYDNNLYMLDSIQNTHLGYRSYNIRSLENGTILNVSKHLISKPEITDLDISEINWDDEIEENVSESGPQNNIQGNRHVIMSEEEINEVAAARLSHNTEAQTKWAANLFRGKYK